jgi:hypothetical protein
MRSGASPVSVRSPNDALPLHVFTRPLIAPSNVDLPAPFEPMIATISPGATSSETSHRTCVSP